MLELLGRLLIVVVLIFAVIGFGTTCKWVIAWLQNLTPKDVEWSYETGSYIYRSEDGYGVCITQIGESDFTSEITCPDGSVEEIDLPQLANVETAKQVLLYELDQVRMRRRNSADTGTSAQHKGQV